MPLEADDLLYCLLVSTLFCAQLTIIRFADLKKKMVKKKEEDEYVIVTRIEGVAKVIEMLNGARILHIRCNYRGS